MGTLALKCLLSLVLLVAFSLVVAFTLKLKLFGRRFLVFDFTLDASRYAEAHPEEKFICFIKYGW